jgi:N-acetylglutamate synthase-like GNAT family acetyltransferase
MCVGVFFRGIATQDEIQRSRSFLRSVHYQTQWLRVPKVRIVQAMLDDHVVGCGSATISGTCAVLMSFVVDPGLRRQQIGSKMVCLMTDYLTQCGLRSAYLLTPRGGPAETFWQKLGFQRVTIEEIVANAGNHYQVRAFVRAGCKWKAAAYRLPLAMRTGPM